MRCAMKPPGVWDEAVTGNGRLLADEDQSIALPHLHIGCIQGNISPIYYIQDK